MGLVTGELSLSPAGADERFQNMRREKPGQRAISMLNDLRWPLGTIAESQRSGNWSRSNPAPLTCPVALEYKGSSGPASTHESAFLAHTQGKTR